MNDAMAGVRKMNEFMHGGADVYWNALRKQYDVEMGQLRNRLKAAGTGPERVDLQQQIARLTEEYRRKCRAIDRSLF